MKLKYYAAILAGLGCLILGFFSSKTAAISPILQLLNQSVSIDLNCWPIKIDPQGNRQSFEKLSFLMYSAKNQQFSLIEPAAVRLVKIEEPRSTFQFEGYARISSGYVFFFEYESERLMAALGEHLGSTSWRLLAFDEDLDSLAQGQLVDPRITLLNDATGQEHHFSQYQLSCLTSSQATFMSPAGQSFTLFVGENTYQEGPYTYRLLSIDMDQHSACIEQSRGVEITFLNLTYADAHF